METAKKEIAILLEKYKRDIASGRLKQLGEENTKKDYITPLFRALGWDVENNRVPDEVTNEDKVSRGKVDYAFRLNSVPKFFLEAKSMKAGITIPDDAIQAINYSWHKNCTWAVLTDFRTLVIYNAEVKEKNIAASQFIYLTCDQFLDEGQFQKLWLLSNPAFKENMLDKEALAWGKKLRKTKVGDQLLQELMGYRTMLSKNILKNNSSKNLSEQDIDEAVQRIIDRLIFIRTTEDRHIEEPVLRPLAREFAEKKRGKLTAALNEVYLRFDKTYNSKLFTFNQGDMAQRHLCETLEIDNEVLQEVINGLYQSRDGLTSYDFSAIDADVLGNIYEQYLSHILRKTEKRAKLESKEAHRKEQGIYYTPTYIVDYIVRNTLGEALKHKKPEEADKIKVLDMACGSGSFLLKAFDTLDNYYRRKEKEDYAQTNLDIEHETARISRKIKILKNNIYGVDLDPKAVEIAQLNLLLKAAETKHRLPDLRENIKCGNSLIDDAQVAGNRAFDWNKEFSEIMGGEGFDIIIGNPPYIRPHRIPLKEKEYLWKTTQSFRAKSDIYNCFMEKGISLLRPGGIIAFIVPHTWISLESFSHIREYILKSCKIVRLVQLPKKVFKDATVETCIFVFQKEPSIIAKSKNKIEVEALDDKGNSKHIKQFMQSVIENNYLYNFELYSDSSGSSILTKLAKMQKLENFVEFFYGLKTGDDDKFISKERRDENSKPLVRSADISRYRLDYHGEYIWYVPQLMIENKKTARPGSPERFEQPKIIVGRMGKELFATYDANKFYVKDGMILLHKSQTEMPLFLLGLINSKVMNYYYKNYFVTIDVLKNAILQLPVPTASKEQKNRLEEYVRIIMEANRRFDVLKDKQTDERIKLEKEIAEIDHKIDELVYDLYDLTAEERKIVEEAAK